MRTAVLILAVVLPSTGCHRLVLRTENKILMDEPVQTRVTADMPPVNPNAGPVRPRVVAPGASSARVAIVDVDGLLLNTPFVGPLSVGENPVALFRERLDAAEADPCVKAVVVRINSHGGGVAACVLMRRDLERFKSRCGKPVVASLLDTACGGAYYLASAADQIVAGEATVTGGLGVMLNLFNLQDLMAQFNVIPQPIKAGELADIGSSARPLQPDEKKLLQVMADELHGRIVSDVRAARPKAAAEVFDGRILTGGQARTKGLVDHLGDLDAAIRVAGTLGCGDGFRPQVVMYRRANDPAHSVYAVTANIPLQGAGLLPNIPGLDRSKLPTFLSIWQPELTMEKLGGK